MALHDLQDVQAGLDHVRMQDQQLLAQAQQEGIIFPGLRRSKLPVEVSLANQVLTKRHFSWAQFLSALESAIPSRCQFRAYAWIRGRGRTHDRVGGDGGRCDGTDGNVAILFHLRDPALASTG